MAVTILNRWYTVAGNHKVEMIMLKSTASVAAGDGFVRMTNLTRVHEITFHNIGIVGASTQSSTNQTAAVTYRWDDKNSKILEFVIPTAGTTYWMIKARGY